MQFNGVRGPLPVHFSKRGTLCTKPPLYSFSGSGPTVLIEGFCSERIVFPRCDSAERNTDGEPLDTVPR